MRNLTIFCALISVLTGNYSQGATNKTSFRCKAITQDLGASLMVIPLPQITAYEAICENESDHSKWLMLRSEEGEFSTILGGILATVGYTQLDVDNIKVLGPNAGVSANKSHNLTWAGGLVIGGAVRTKVSADDLSNQYVGGSAGIVLAAPIGGGRSFFNQTLLVRLTKANETLIQEIGDAVRLK